MGFGPKIAAWLERSLYRVAHPTKRHEVEGEGVQPEARKGGKTAEKTHDFGEIYKMSPKVKPLLIRPQGVLQTFIGWNALFRMFLESSWRPIFYFHFE